MSQQCSTCGKVYFTVTHNCPDNMPDDFDSNISEETLGQWIPDSSVYEEPDESPCIHCGVHSGSLHRHTCPNVTHRELKWTVDDLLNKITRYKNRSKSVKSSIHVTESYMAEHITNAALNRGLTVKVRGVNVRSKSFADSYIKITIVGRYSDIMYIRGLADGMRFTR